MTQINGNRTWKRLKQNKAAIAALCFILLTILVAIFAYLIAPDHTPDANTMNVEIATQKSGFQCLFFKKYKSTVTRHTFGHRLLFGQEAEAELIPVKEAKIIGDSIHIAHIADEQIVELQTYPIDRKIPDTYNHYIIKRTFWLGTDKYGRDMLSRLLIGTRISLAVGFIAVIISLLIGVMLGSFSAYFAGITDMAITWLINVIWAIPTLLLVFAITSVLGKGFWLIFIAVGFTMWVGTARLIRGQVMGIKELEYIHVARTMGFSSWRIIFRHIIPNVMGPTIVMAASNFATAILIEAGLSFLGIGVQPPVSSWGLMIKANYNFIITNRPMLAIIPGIAIMLIVLAFNILGNALRDALDVKGTV
ncbi:MAG: ABC transporter permease [Chitinophagaceae bacterium]|nr:ABC transporter permease [Chitinophagaceae bacterium]